MQTQVDFTRKKEKKLIESVYIQLSIVEALANFMPVLAGLLSFWVYELIYPDDKLSVA